MERDAQGKPGLRVGPVWKVLGPDGRFTVFAAVTEDGYGVITNEGTYTVTSDSTYTERIEQTNIDSTLVGWDNKMTFHYFHRDLVGISYRLPGADEDTHEVWRRVTFRMPGQRDPRGPHRPDGQRPPHSGEARSGNRSRQPRTGLNPQSRQNSEATPQTGDPLFDETD